MDTKKPRNRRHHTEWAQQELRDLFQKEKVQRHAVIDALAQKRAAREMAHMAMQEPTFASSSMDSLLPTTSNPAPPQSPSIYATIDDLTDGDIIQLTFDDEFIPLEVPISPAIVSLSINHLHINQQHKDFEATGGVQSPTPGCAFQPNQFDQKAQQELVTQEQSLQEHELMFIHIYSDEGESEMDSDGPTLSDGHYPLDLEVGKDNNDEYRGEVEDGSIQFRRNNKSKKQSQL